MKRTLLIVSIVVNILFGVFAAYAAVPFVSWTYPANGATEVPVTTPIAVVFNENISWITVSNDTTINYSIKVFEDASNTPFKAITYTPQEDNYYYILNLTSELKSNTTYRVFVAATVRSVSSGDSMVADYVFKFTTSTAPDVTPPTIQSFLPPSGSTNNPLDSIVSIFFSEAIDKTTLTGTNIFLLDKFNATVPVTISYDDTINSVILTPVSPLSLNGVYRLNVTNGLKDLAGHPLAPPLAVNPAQPEAQGGFPPKPS